MIHIYSCKFIHTGGLLLVTHDARLIQATECEVSDDAYMYCVDIYPKNVQNKGGISQMNSTSTRATERFVMTCSCECVVRTRLFLTRCPVLKAIANLS